MKRLFTNWSPRSTRGVRKKITIAAFVLFSAMISMPVLAQFSPFHYWTFDNPTNALRDSAGNCTLNPAYYQCVYTINISANGSVGRSLGLDPAAGRVIVASTNILPDSVFVVEFLFKSGPYFNTTELVKRRDGAVYIKMGYPFIQFNTSVKVNSTTVTDAFKIDLEGIGRASYGYYTDGKWHHLVFKYNGKTGTKEIWVDGQLPAGFSQTVVKGKFSPNTGSPNLNIIDINSNTSYNKLSGSLDEIAMYTIDIPGSVIYKHYLESKNGQHYSFTSSTLVPPSPAPVTASVNIDEYAPGHPAYSVTALEQLRTFPLPRYKASHTMARNFNWIAMDYFAGLMQPGITYSQAVNTSVQMQSELAGNWNYHVLVSGNTGNHTQYTDVTKFHGAWVQLANQNPQWGAAAISFWNQLNPTAAGYTSNTGYVENKTLPLNHYLRNNSGQFLTPTGATTTSRYISPAAPLDSFYLDGNTQKFYLNKLLGALTRPLNIISENAEVIPKLNSTAMSSDPLVTADKNLTGLDWDTYQGNRKARIAKIYRDQFKSLSALSNTFYGEYQISGHNTRHKYSETRTIQSMRNGQYYATPDLYPRWPSNWLTGTGPWNGWQHIIDGRNVEIPLGDKLFSPYIAAGWNSDEERNIRPAQWLGLLKAVGALGAEFYYTGYFNEASSYNPPNPPPNNPAGYAYQAVMPSYAQAITSRYEDLLRNGTLLNGDMPNNYSNPTGPGYTFKCGDQRKLVVIRKDNQANRYAIVSTIQPNSNMNGNAELETDANITLNGQQLQFKVRRQGSTYIYDNSNSQSPVFFQIDSWHEEKHPFFWTKDFNFEAEVYDNTPANSTIITRRPAGAAAGDYREYTTCVKGTSASATMPYFEYRFTPRYQPVYYLWVKARSTNGNAAGMNVTLNSQNSKLISCITDTSWRWYSIEACNATKILFSGLGNQEYRLGISPTSVNLEIDKVLLTTDQYLNLNANQAPCSQNQITVSASGSLDLCAGQSVTLTAPQSASYSWSSGQTTQSITVTTAGTYSVSVNQGGACNLMSQPVTVTNATGTSAAITANTNDLSVSDTIILSATGGVSYLWQPGNISGNTLTVTTPGTYIVTATNANGCTSVSPAFTVIQSIINYAVDIQANGPLQFCHGGNVTLTASGGPNYVWFPGGQTTNSLEVTESGTYYARVIDAGGNIRGEDSITVNVLPQPMVPFISMTYFPGNAYQFLAMEPSAATYQWSTGATSAAITVTAASTITVTVTNAFGCSEQLTFQVADPANTTCRAPDMLLHSNASDTSVTLQWNPAIQSDGFRIRYWPAGSSQVNEVLLPGNVSLKTINGLSGATTYNWSVEALCGNTPHVSQTKEFSTLGNILACGSRPMHTAEIDIVPRRATLTWYATQADGFTVKYRAAGNTTYKYVQLPGSSVGGTTLTGLSPNTTYEWQVKSTCNGYMSSFTDVDYFTTPDTCGFLGTVSVSLVKAHNVTLHWGNFNQMDSIRIRVTNVATGQRRVVKLNYNPSNGTYRVNGLQSGTEYKAEVRGTCANGIAGAWTEPVFFTTLGSTLREDETLQLNAYPNPATSFINYSFMSGGDGESPYSVRVCDMSGRQLIQEVHTATSGVNSNEIPVSGFAKGVYLLIVTHGTMTGHFRFSVQ